MSAAEARAEFDRQLNNCVMWAAATLWAYFIVAWGVWAVSL